MAKQNSNKKKSFKAKGFGVEYEFTLGEKGKILCDGQPTTTLVQGGESVVFNHAGIWWPLKMIQSKLG